MPDLEMLLREIKPAPDPAWALKLDTRVAHRFPGPPPRWKSALLTARDHLLAIGAVATVTSLMLVIVIAGVSYDGGGDDAAEPAGGSGTADVLSDGGSGGSSVPEPTSEEALPTTSPKQKKGPSEFSARSAQPATAGAPTVQEDRAVKTDTALTLSTTPDKVPSVADRAIIVVDSLGGFVQSSQVDQSGTRSASAELSLRIPSARLDDGLARLSKLAHVKARSQQTQDLTDTREALEARVRDARADREGLRARLAKATTDKERSRLRAALDRATKRVTQRQRQVNELNHEVSYASVALSIDGDRRSGAAAPPAGRWTPNDAIGDAVRVLEVIAGVLVIALAVLLPVAVIAVLAVLAGRVITRRRRERALEMA